MKKLIIILIVLSFLYSRSECANNQTKTSAVKQKVVQVFNTVNNSLDYMLTTKGALKTTIVLAPFLTLYCHYFNIDPIQGIINKIIQKVGSAQELYNIQREIGKSQAFWESTLKQPLEHVYIISQKLLDKTINVGLPVITGLLIKKRFNL